MYTLSGLSENQKGFTLVEIIIALVVISVALGAVISTTGYNVSHGLHIKEKTLALWVAENYLSDISITEQWPSSGLHTHEVFMADRNWFLNNKVIQTPDKAIRRLDISVYSDRSYENKLLTFIAYINKPQPLITTVTSE